MAILITAPIVGSLKITDTSASPMSYYLCNLKTVTINGDFGSNTVNILNMSGQPIAQLPNAFITNIGASGGLFVNNLNNTVNALASLVITS